MPKQAEPTENLKSFDAYVDDSGQNPSDAPNEVGRAAELQRVLKSKPDGESETARLASARRPGAMDDATDAVEAEVPAETIRHLSDASLGGSDSPVERATSGLGKDRG